MSVLVPPTSKAMSRPVSATRPTAAAATTPAAGPESSVLTGWVRALSSDMTPPFDWMIENAPSKPKSRNAASSRSARAPIFGMV